MAKHCPNIVTEPTDPTESEEMKLLHLEASAWLKSQLLKAAAQVSGYFDHLVFSCISSLSNDLFSG